MPLDPELRPVLRRSTPLLSRSDHDLQIGLGSEAVIIADPGGSWRCVLDYCGGSVSLAELRRSAAAGPVLPELDTVLERLAQSGLLDLIEPTRARARRRGRLIGAGPLGAEIGRLLVTQLQPLYVVDPDPPQVALYPGSSAEHQAAAFCAEFSSRRARPVDHWSKPEGVDIAITVIAASTLEPDRTVSDDLVRADQPHLIVRPLPSGVVVGPLVIPGRTACLRCCDLSRRDLDPDWPLLLAQLRHVPGTLDRITLSWGAAVAATQVCGFLVGNPVETLSATLELSSRDHRQQWRSWAAHSECGCHW